MHATPLRFAESKSGGKGISRALLEVDHVELAKDFTLQWISRVVSC